MVQSKQKFFIKNGRIPFLNSTKNPHPNLCLWTLGKNDKFNTLSQNSDHKKYHNSLNFEIIIISHQNQAI